MGFYKVESHTQKCQQSSFHADVGLGKGNCFNILYNWVYLPNIKGPLCSGKTYCAQEVATARKLPMKTLQINDDLDSRTIFGSYSCTDVPGEFVWQPSMFSKCLKEECLILLKSFDTAHVDLVAAILSLAETHSYRVQGEGICKVNEGCRIVASMSSEGNLSLLRDYPYAVNLQPLTNEEHSQILSMRFPI
uniref:ATPase dynein-related AAA domain-containing protein n=1 Tax=Ditylenchus dipsaci TaxID=166011 RepID=A0A915D4D8_9BILA